MIAKNIAGQNISQEFINALTSGFTNFSVKLVKSSALDVIIERLTLSLGAGSSLSDTEDFAIGSVFSNALEASIYEEGKDILEIGQAFTVQVGVEVSSGYEYVQVGKFTVTDKETWLGRSTIKARGFAFTQDVNQAAGLATGFMAASDLASTLASKLGVGIAISGLSGNAYVTAEMSVLEALEALAKYTGGYIAETNEGGLCLYKFSSSATYILPSEYVTRAPQLSKEVYTLDGLKVVGEQEYSFGTGKITLTLPEATQAIADNVWDNVKNYTFTPGSIDVAIIDPRVTPSDVISCTLDGTAYIIPAHGISISYDGGYYGTYSSVGISSTLEDTLRPSGITGRLEGAELAAAEAEAIANGINQHFWTDTQGAHITDDDQISWTEEYVKENHGELANPTDTKPWFNQLISSIGTLIRSGLINLVSITRSAIAFYDGLGNSASNIVARFGKDGAQIGYTSGDHITLSSSGLGVYSGTSYSNVNGVDVNQTATDAATAKSDASSAKTTANTANTTANTAKTTADTAKSTADTAKSTADTAKTTADNAATAATEAKNTANATKQNFWADTNGVHVSTQANTAAGTFNSLFNSTGLIFRKTDKYLLSLTGSALNFYDGTANAAANITASFGASGAVIGKTSSINTRINTSGFYIRSGTTNIASFTYEPKATASYPIGPGASMEFSDGWDTLKITPGAITSGNNPFFVVPATGGVLGTANGGGVAWDGLSAGLWANAKNGLRIDDSWTYLRVNGFDALSVQGNNQAGMAVLLGAGGLTIIGGGEFASNFYDKASVASDVESLYLGSDTDVYVYTNAQTFSNARYFLFTAAGHLLLPSGQSSIVHTGTNLTEQAPSTTQYQGGLHVLDKYSTQLAYFRGLHTTGNLRGLQLETKRLVSETWKYNTLNLTIDASGNAQVGIGGTNATAAWRTAIGANNAANITTGTLPVARGGTGTSAFGNLTNVNGANTSCANNTATQVASITLAAGTWIIFAGFNIAANATGVRYMNISTTSKDTGNSRLTTCRVQAPNAGACMQNISVAVTIGSSTTYYANVLQNSGSALTASCYLRAIRIK